MQRRLDPLAQSGLVNQLISGGITALVAGRIAERKGQPMSATAEPHVDAATAPPTPEPVMHMLHGLQAAGIVKGAVDLGVFDEIAAGRTDAESIALAIGADGRATRILLDALAALGLVTAGPDYGLTRVADAFLVRDRPAYIGGAADIFTGTWAWENYGRLAEIVRHGGTIMERHAEAPGHDFWATFASSSAGIATPAALTLAQTLAPWADERPGYTVLDIACGGGLYGLHAVRSLPAARLTLLDWGNVLERARENAERLGLGDRTEYIDGDVFEVGLGGPYDLVIASHFFHHFSEEQCLRALRRLAAVLKPGGRIAIHEFAASSPDPAAEPFPRLFSVVMLAWSRQGEAYSVEDYARWLDATGFGAPEVHAAPGMPSRFIIAELGA
jgi:C-methyltransferase